ncbi:hypothetical protein BX666DRAFT_1851714 [Dichotomocladium elegans]|nr:hypothetical protein BX666DRAFT_1851714 [Dichotomocladium elegans]
MDDKGSTNVDFIHESNLRTITIIARECGFDSIQRSALEKLADLLEQYLQNILYNTHTYSELGCRTRPNYHDTPSKEASDSYNFLCSDDDEENDEVRKATTSLPEYVPSYMPKFPSRHSFRQTPVYIHRPDDPQRVRELNSQQSRIVEENLKRLMSAENQLIRRQERADADMLDLTVPIVNYEGAIQRKRRVKGSHTSDIRAITVKLENGPNPNHHQTQLLQ